VFVVGGEFRGGAGEGFVGCARHRDKERGVLYHKRDWNRSGNMVEDMFNGDGG